MPLPNLFIFTISLSLFILPSQAQIDTIGENSGPYWPVKAGDKKHYWSKNGAYVQSISNEPVTFNNKQYFRSVDAYENSTGSVLYLREENGNVFVYDTVKQIEFLELSNNTTPGYTWTKYDGSWKYTVIDTTSTVTTPFAFYSHLLKIKAEPLGKTKKEYSDYYHLCYARGVGLVNLDVNGKGYEFLTVDPATVESTDFYAKGCEGLDDQAATRACTMQKISQEISNRFNYNGKIKKGSIEIQLIIDENGNVAEATAHKPLKNADGQTQEAIRILQSMTFSPRTLNGKPVRTAVVVPVKF